MDEKIVEAIRDGLYKNGCEIEFLQSETENIMATINKSADALVNEKIEEFLPVLKEKAHTDAVRQVRAEYRIAEGVKIGGLSPFISETIMVNGEELNRNHFFPNRCINDPLSEDVRLFFDDLTERWLVRVKSGTSKFISRFVVTACLIVDASGPGSCRAYVVFLKGEAKPLIFWKGIIEAAELRKQTQFHKKGLSYARKDLYHESFMRALSMCSSVYFLTLPRHAGWNWTPEGSRIFVDSEMMQPQFEDLFLTDDHEDTKKKGNKMHNVFLDVSLSSTDRKFDDVVADYHSLIPDTLPMKIGTVISAMSRLLPFYKEEGLVQDRLWLFETADDATAKTMTAVIKNRHHLTTEALFSSMRLPYLEEEIKKYVDCTAVLRHSCAICTMHDFIKILKFLFELIQNGYADEGGRRLVPVLFIDNAGVVPEELLIHQISISDRIHFDNVEQIQGILGVLDYHIVKNTERNPDAVQQSLKAAITTAKEMVYTFPRRSQSSSAVMLLSTAIMLKEGGVLTDADVQEIQEWLFTEAKSRTSMSRCVCNSVGAVLSRAIFIEHKSITYKDGPQPWTPASYYVAEDDSINVTKDDFDVIISELSVGKNTALKYLKAEDVLIANKGEEQKTWKVENEDGIKKQRRFYAFSRELLTPEANRIIDEYVASDVFHRIEEAIEHFFPYIKHHRLDMACGQFIKEYNTINPFVAVCGSPGSGKTDLLMMQALQRATADDVVIFLDPTNSYCEYEWSQHKVPKKIVDERVLFWDMSVKGFPIDLLDFSNCTNVYQKRERLFSMLLSGSHLSGCNQLNILMTAVEIMVDKIENGEKNMYNLIVGSFGDKKDEIKVMNRVLSVFSTIATNNEAPPGWDKLLADRGKIIVISTGNATVKVDCNPLDMVADHLYSYKDAHRAGNVSLILDEIQTMNLDIGAPIDILLSNGRKVNIAAFLASQRYSNGNDNLGRVFDYCGTKIFFSPMESCIEAVSEKTHISVDVLRGFEQGECAFIGPAYSEHKGKNIPIRNALIGKSYRPSYVGSYD